MTDGFAKLLALALGYGQRWPSTGECGLGLKNRYTGEALEELEIGAAQA